MRHITHWLSPTGFVLAGLCFLMTFVTVACDTPGGYGRVKPGGTTSYTGVDLVVGGVPTVDPQFLLPPEQWREDRVPPQPLAIAGLLLVVIGLAVATLRRDPRIRRAATAAAAGLAALLLLANQARVETLLVDRVREQVRVAAPQAPITSDYVHTGNGLGICLLLLVAVCAGNAIGWLRVRHRARRVRSPAAGQPESVGLAP